MSYIRISLMRPKAGQEDRVRAILDELVMYHETLPGYQVGYRVERAGADDDRVGRLAIWAFEHDASRAAQDTHDMALRSQLNQFVQEDSHEEITLLGHYAPKV